MTVFLPAELSQQIDTTQIQGNVLPGFKADHQYLVGVRFTDAAGGRHWISTIAGDVTTAAEVLAHRRRVHNEEAGPADHDPWVSVAFTGPALQSLAFGATFTDAAFNAGMEASSTSILGDDPASLATWRVGAGIPVDALLVVAASSASEARAEAVRLCAVDGVDVVYCDEGATLPHRRGHEHFGFRDGISQPGIFGQEMHTAKPITERDWKDAVPEETPLQATPGTVLIWPGQFVFGYAGQGSAPNRPGPVAVAGDQGADLTSNGSYLVFRRLRQDVAGFHRLCAAKAAELGGSSWPGMTGDLMEALVVGRWPSGALVDATRHTVDPGAPDDLPPNGFDFGDDPDGRACPLAAHIRKVNPRAQPSDVVPAVRRLLRRGIPYGRELPEPVTMDDGVDRGLLFLSYQTSIEQIFEKVVNDWMNDPNRPSVTGAGDDVLMGQVEGERFMMLPRGIRLSVDKQWIAATGGVYAFAPSLAAIARLATG